MASIVPHRVSLRAMRAIDTAAPRPGPGDRLLGGRRRARRSRARPRPRAPARGAGRAASSRARSCSPTSTSTTPARPGRSCAAGPGCRSTCTSAARGTWRPGAARRERDAALRRGEMDRLWGEVVPVPEADLHVLDGGERVLGDYRVAVHARPRLPPRLLPPRADGPRVRRRRRGRRDPARGLRARARRRRPTSTSRRGSARSTSSRAGRRSPSRSPTSARSTTSGRTSRRCAQRAARPGGPGGRARPGGIRRGHARADRRLGARPAPGPTPRPRRSTSSTRAWTAGMRNGRSRG